ncbi:hypothetical protein NQZ68_009300 [Dissostichus eleginoides]|nr:hypothetical protein NQZ68_009300 [Dissostichus eleginoides]
MHGRRASEPRGRITVPGQRLERHRGTLKNLNGPLHPSLGLTVHGIPEQNSFRTPVTRDTIKSCPKRSRVCVYRL